MLTINNKTFSLILALSFKSSAFLDPVVHHKLLLEWRCNSFERKKNMLRMEIHWWRCAGMVLLSLSISLSRNIKPYYPLFPQKLIFFLFRKYCWRTSSWLYPLIPTALSPQISHSASVSLFLASLPQESPGNMRSG